MTYSLVLLVGDSRITSNDTASRFIDDILFETKDLSHAAAGCKIAKRALAGSDKRRKKNGPRFTTALPVVVTPSV